MNHNQLTALRQLCDRVVADQYSHIDVDDALIVAKGCLSALNEIALLEEQRGGNTTPIFWELLAERDKLKEEVDALEATVNTLMEGQGKYIDEIKRLDERHVKELNWSSDYVFKLETQLKTTREALEPFAQGQFTREFSRENRQRNVMADPTSNHRNTGHQVMTDQEEKAVCACLEVVYKAIANENGAMTEAWCCKRCNTRFVRQFWLQKAHEKAYEEGRDDMREKAVQACKKEGKRDENPSKEQRLLAEERALACYRCADEVKAIK